jgi:hypothetical protein
LAAVAEVEVGYGVRVGVAAATDSHPRHPKSPEVSPQSTLRYLGTSVAVAVLVAPVKDVAVAGADADAVDAAEVGLVQEE